MRSILLSAAVVTVIGGLGAFDSARAAALAFDSAADPAYVPYRSGGQLPNGINGGYGWGSGWTGLGGPFNFKMNVTGTAGATFTNPYISPGYAWFLPWYSGFENITGAERFFDGGLEPGQTFSFDFLSFGQSIYLLEPSGTWIYEIDTGVFRGLNCFITFEGRSYAQLELTVPYTDEGDHFSITPIDANDAILAVTSYGPGGGSNSIEIPYSTIGGVYFAAQKEEYVNFNNISITPEPRAEALFAAVGFGLLLRRKCRSLIA